MIATNKLSSVHRDASLESRVLLSNTSVGQEVQVYKLDVNDANLHDTPKSQRITKGLQYDTLKFKIFTDFEGIPSDTKSTHNSLTELGKTLIKTAVKNSITFFYTYGGKHWGTSDTGAGERTDFKINLNAQLGILNRQYNPNGDEHAVVRLEFIDYINPNTGKNG